MPRQGTMKKAISLITTIFIATYMIFLLWEVVVAIPVLTNTGITLTENATITISNAELEVTDSADPTATFTFTVDTKPTNGTLFRDGLALTNGSTFTQTDIDSSLITYTHSGSETTSDSFVFSVFDGVSTIFNNETFPITVTPINDPPTAVPDTLHVLEGGMTSITDESNNSLIDNDTDPDTNHGNLTADNAPISGPGFGTANIGSSGSFDYTHDDTENFSDTFTYRVCDDEPLCADGTVTVVITPVVDIAPDINAQSLNINENSNNSAIVGTITVSDIEVTNGYDALTYTISSGNLNNAFALHQTSGQVTVNNQAALNHESNSSITMTVLISDLATLQDSAVVTIFINDINEPPNISTGQIFNIDENSVDDAVVGTVTAVDVDDDQLTYSILSGNIGGAFKIISTTGQLQVANGSQLNYEVLDTYTLNIQVQDDGTGNLVDAANVTVNINPVNEAPTFLNQTFNINENSPNSANVGVLAVSDPEVDDPDQTDTLFFSILSGNNGNAFALNSGSGQLTVQTSSELDHETTDQYVLTVEVRDSGLLTDTALITIDIIDVNEAPTITPDQDFSIPENSLFNTNVGTVAANDPDDGDDILFSITSGNLNNAFTINVNTGQIKVNNTNALDFENTPTFVLTVQVTDGSLPVNDIVTINLTNVNEAPFMASGQLFSVVGYSDNGTNVGTVIASDPDAGDILFYKIKSGNSGNAFTINSSTGKITVNNRDALDFDQIQLFTLGIEVTDLLNVPYNETVQITVTEPPIYFAYIPLIFNDYHPEEPNNVCNQSYALSTNLTYTFFPDDKEDWYKFTITSTKTNVEAILTNYGPVGQIIAYKGNCNNLQFMMNNGAQGSTKKLIMGTLTPGTYYIRVVTDPPYQPNQGYNLRIKVP
jgi:hypothetical protein